MGRGMGMRDRQYLTASSRMRLQGNVLGKYFSTIPGKHISRITIPPSLYRYCQGRTQPGRTAPISLVTHYQLSGTPRHYRIRISITGPLNIQASLLR